MTETEYCCNKINAFKYTYKHRSRQSFFTWLTEAKTIYSYYHGGDYNKFKENAFC